MTAVKKLKWHQLEDPKNFGLAIEPKMMRVEARELPKPQVCYQRPQVMKPRWDLRGSRLRAVSCSSYKDSR